MTTEYIAKIKGDTSGLESAIQKAQGRLERLNDNEVIIKFDYDSNEQELNKIIKNLVDKNPELNVEIKYQINKAALEQERKKLSDMELTADTSKLIKKIQEVHKYYTEIFTSASDKELSAVEHEMAQLYSTILNCADGLEALEKLPKQLQEQFEDLEEVDPLRVFSEAEINKQRGIVDKFQESLKNLSSQIKTLDDQAGSNKGLSNVNEDINKTKDSLQELVNQFGKYADKHDYKQISSFWDDYRASIEKGNKEAKDLLSTLKLIDDESGSINLVDAGMVKSGGIIGSDKVLLATKNRENSNGSDRLNETIALKKKLDEAADAGINVARILDIVSDSEKKVFLELQERAPGKNLGNYEDYWVNPELFQATDEQIKKLIEDYRRLNELGIGVDANLSNILYDKEKGFSFIDLDLKPAQYEDDAEALKDLLGGITGSIRDFYEDLEDKSGMTEADALEKRILSIADATKTATDNINKSAKSISGEKLVNVEELDDAKARINDLEETIENLNDELYGTVRQSSYDYVSEQLSEAREEVDALNAKLQEQQEILTKNTSDNNLVDAKELKEETKLLDTFTDKLEYLKKIKSDSKFMETAEERLSDMEDKAWDVGGNNPKSEADSQKKIRQYEELEEHIDKANAALDEFNNTYEKCIITLKSGEEIEIFDWSDLDSISLAKNKIQDIQFVLREMNEEQTGITSGNKSLQELVELYHQLGTSGGAKDEMNRISNSILDIVEAEEKLNPWQMQKFVETLRGLTFVDGDNPIQKIPYTIQEAVDAFEKLGNIKHIINEESVSLGKSSPTQQFDNEIQQNLVMLENYKNTIKEIDRLKLDPETDEAKHKIQELNKLADYFASRITTILSENGHEISRSMMQFNGNWNNHLRENYTSDQIKDFWKVAGDRSGLNRDTVTTEFSGISEEIKRIESNSESLRQSLNKSLSDSRNYVNHLQTAFLDLVDTTSELKTETSPKWIEVFQKDINNIIKKYPELEQFRDKFLSLGSARDFVKSDGWNDFLSTLPKAHTYLEELGYDFQKVKDETPVSTENSIEKQTEALREEEIQAEKTAEAIKEAADAQNHLNQEQKEQPKQQAVDQNVSEALNKERAEADVIGEVAKAVDDKTERFEKERKAVTEAIDAEINKLKELQQELDTVSTGERNVPKSDATTVNVSGEIVPLTDLYNILNNIVIAVREKTQAFEQEGLEVTASVKTENDALTLLLETLKQIADVAEKVKLPTGEKLQWTNDLKKLNAEDIAKIGTNLTAMYQAISNLNVKDSNFIKQLNEILNKGKELENLAKVLSSSQKNISQAQENVKTDKEKSKEESYKRELAVSKEILALRHEINKADATSSSKYDDISAKNNAKIAALEKEREQIRADRGRNTSKDLRKQINDEIKAIEQVNKAEVDALRKTTEAREQAAFEAQTQRQQEEIAINIQKEAEAQAKAAEKASSARNEEAARGYKEIIKSAKEYYSLLAKEGNNTITGSEEIKLAQLKTAWEKAKEAKDEYALDTKGSVESQKKYNDAKSAFDNSAIDTAVRYSQELEGIKKKLQDFKGSEKYTADLNNRLGELADRITEINKKPIDLVNPKELSEIEDIRQEATKLFDEVKTNEAKLASAETVAKLNVQIEEYMRKNSKMGRQFRQEFENLKIKFDTAPTVEAVKQVVAEFNNLKVKVEEAGRTGQSVFDKIKARAIDASTKFIGQYLSIQDFIRYGREAFNVIRDLDTQLVDLRKTTSMNSMELENFYENSTKVAKSLGVTSSEIISQAAAWSRLGYSTNEEATKMAELSSKFASISPGMDTEKATDGLVSAMKGFGIVVDDVERSIMDNINRIGNTMATSNSEIVDMLERSSAAMKAANNTIEETIALESAAVQITRNAETTGTAFRTISMRIRGYDEETEEFIGNVEELTGKIADLTKTAKTPGGISLFTDTAKTQYKSTYQLLKEIASVYQDLSDKNQAALLETLAG